MFADWPKPCLAGRSDVSRDQAPLSIIGDPRLWLTLWAGVFFAALLGGTLAFQLFTGLAARDRGRGVDGYDGINLWLITQKE